MSAAPPPAPPSTPSSSAPATPNQITVISHCTLFYWWPVWAVGFIIFGLTYWDQHRMVIVSHQSEVKRDVSGKVKEPKQNGFEEINIEDKDILILPANMHFPKDRDPLKLHASTNKNYGVLFATTLLLVIIITNVPLRGGWSFALIIFAIMTVIIFALADLLDKILENLSYLDIRINAGGYLFISSILFGLWLIAMLIFDRRIYVIFEPGQIRVCTEIGGGQQVYPSAGAALEKQRSDLFRHLILGLGSGDLIVRTAGAQAHNFELHNVLFIGSKVKQIEAMLKKVVVTR